MRSISHAWRITILTYGRRWRCEDALVFADERRHNVRKLDYGQNTDEFVHFTGILSSSADGCKNIIL